MGERLYRIALLILVLFLPVAQGCGKKGPPLPPIEEKGVTAPSAPAEAAPEVKPEEPQPSPAPAPEPKAPY